MNVRRRFGLLWVLVTAAIATAAGYFSYQAGVSAGLAASAAAGGHLLIAPGYYGPGLGFGFFGLLPLLFLILLGFALFGRRRWGGWHGKYGQYGAWHQHPHGEQAPATPDKPQGEARGDA